MTNDQPLGFQKKKKILKILVIFCSLLLIFILIIGGYAYFRSSATRAILMPVSSRSKEADLASELTKAGISYETPFSVSGETITASSSGLTVHFSSTKDIAKQVRSLQLLLSTVKMKDEKVTDVDLRFDKAVLK